MITLQQAVQIAETELSEISKHSSLGDDTLIIVVDQIIEKEYGWIFPYASRKIWETDSVDHAIGGNSPLFISKWNGQVSSYPTYLTIEGMIDQYDCLLGELASVIKSVGNICVGKSELSKPGQIEQNGWLPSPIPIRYMSL